MSVTEYASGATKKLGRLRSTPREAARDSRLIILTIATGAVDATAFEKLGHVFASVITGNLILLAVGAIHANGRQELLTGCALVGYMLGVLVASLLPGQRSDDKHELWPSAAAVALSIELGLVGAFVALWEADAAHPGRTTQPILLGLLAGAMGSQSGAVRRVGEMSTTYLTGTLTGLVEAAAARRWTTDEARSLAIFSAAFCGAALATLLGIAAPRFLPLAAVVPLLVAIFSSRSGLAALAHVRVAPGRLPRGPFRS